jgi:hypothetical protein
MTRRSDAWLSMRRLWILLGAVLIAGCTMPVREGKLDPALFGRRSESVERRMNAQISIVTDEALAQFKYERTKRGESTWVFPVGQIVEAATVAALTDELGHPIEIYRSPSAAAEASGSSAVAAMIVPSLVKFEFHDESFPLFIPLVPMAIPITTREDVRLIVDWQVLAPDGTLLWTRRYDSGDVKLNYGRPGDRNLAAIDLYVRLIHEAAYALMREAARDTRNWIEAERLRERVL